MTRAPRPEKGRKPPARRWLYKKFPRSGEMMLISVGRYPNTEPQKVIVWKNGHYLPGTTFPPRIDQLLKKGAAYGAAGSHDL
jgi:hypothetical protein